MMNKYKDNTLATWTDDIILLNDNYIGQGLKKGYVGMVVENLIEERGTILADFLNPITGEDIAILVEIKKEDFRVYAGTLEDQKIGRAFRNLFLK
ncbi:MAG: hypothetical protein IJX49_05340 [Clostridia bacterium]|nr:hypothetical protein [Clostridia bacterium]